MHTLNSRKRKSEYLKMLKRNDLLEQVKPKLKEIFYSIDKSEVSTQLVPQIKEALQLLNLGHFASKIEGFEDQFAKVKESMAEDALSFEDFTNMFFNVLDMMDNQDNPKEHVMFDFIDPSKFVFAPNSKVISKDFSSKILDESVILQKRIDMNYSINNSVSENIKVLKALENDCRKNYSDSPYLDSFLKYSYSLRDCWTWVGKCIEQKGTSNNLTRGLREVLGSLYGTKASLNNHVEKIYLIQYRVYSNQERQEALSSLGWGYIFDPSSKPHLHANAPTDLEETYSRNAALSVFNFDFAKAYQALANIQSSSNEIAFMKSILQLLKDWYISIQHDKEMKIVFSCETSRFYDECDENEKPEDFSSEVLYRRAKPSKYDAAIKELKIIQTLCQHLNPIDPYFRAICRFIANKEKLSHIIKDHCLSFLDRIAFAYRFLGPKSLQAFLNETIEEAKENGYLGALFLVGKNPTGFEIIQQYVDKTADVQSIALLGVYFRLFKFPNEDMFKSFLLDYKDILNKFRRWEDRIKLERSIYELEKSFVFSVKDRKSSDHANVNANHINDVKCYFCNGPISKVSPLNLPGENRMVIAQMYKNKAVNSTSICSECAKPLPNCGLCLLPVSILNPYIEQQEKTKRMAPKKENTMIDPEEALLWCQQCKHGGHFAHIDEWFLNHTKCPVSGCVCECFQNLYP